MAVALLLFEGAVALCFTLGKPAGATTSNNPADYDDPKNFITVGEIHAANANNSGQNVQQLYNLLTGKTNATLADVTALAKTSSSVSGNVFDGYSAADIRAKTDGNRDIRVYFGGALWNVCYLSTNANNQPILTLRWVSNAVQSPYMYLTNLRNADGGLETAFGKGLETRLYDYSYVRAVSLNNGGTYYESKWAETTNEVAYESYFNGLKSMSASQDKNNPFAKFTMSSNEVPGSVTDAIERVKYMPWQSATFVWREDRLWLPSFDETGVYDAYYGGQGLRQEFIVGSWKLSQNQLANGDVDYTDMQRNVSVNSGEIRQLVVRRLSYEEMFDEAYPETSELTTIHPAVHVNLTATSIQAYTKITASTNYTAGNPIPNITLNGVTAGDAVYPVLEYSYNGNGFTTGSTAPTATDPVGTYTVTVTGLTGADASKYKLTGTTSFDFTMSTDAYYDYSLEYAGTMSITDLIGMTPWYRNGMQLSCNRTIKDAGTYTLTVQQGDKTNSVELTILPKQLSVTLSGGGWVIGDAVRLPKAGAISGVVSGDKVVAAVQYYDNLGREIVNEQGYTAGTYQAKMTLSGVDAGNYKIAGTTTQEFTVSSPIVAEEQTDNFDWQWFTVAALGGSGLALMLGIAGALISRRKPKLDPRAI